MKLSQLAVFLVLSATLRAEQCLVIGDSLSKEYEVEFPILFRNNREAWDSRNWIEILDQHRGTWFDTGKWSGFADPRILGHEHNWAFPRLKHRADQKPAQQPLELLVDA
jgi:hypothetical protein